MVSKTQRRMRIFILTVGISTALFMVVFPGWARFARKNDLSGAKPQQAAALLTQVVPSGVNGFTGALEEGFVQIQFRGKVEYAHKISDFSRLHAGQNAQITYRVGRSGRIYIDRVEPLEAGK